MRFFNLIRWDRNCYFRFSSYFLILFLVQRPKFRSDSKIFIHCNILKFIIFLQKSWIQLIKFRRTSFLEFYLFYFLEYKYIFDHSSSVHNFRSQNQTLWWFFPNFYCWKHLVDANVIPIWHFQSNVVQQMMKDLRSLR